MFKISEWRDLANKNYTYACQTNHGPFLTRAFHLIYKKPYVPLVKGEYVVIRPGDDRELELRQLILAFKTRGQDAI